MVQHLNSIVACTAGSACPVMDVLLEQGGKQGCSLGTTDSEGSTAWHKPAEVQHLMALWHALQGQHVQ